MAADSQVTDGGTFTTRVNKIVRMSDGSLFATAGDADDRDLVEYISRCIHDNVLPNKYGLSKTEFSGKTL